MNGWILNAFAEEKGLLFADSLQQTGDGAFSTITGGSTAIDDGVSAPVAPSGVEVAELSSPTLPHQLNGIETNMMLEGSPQLIPMDSISEWENVVEAHLL